MAKVHTSVRCVSAWVNWAQGEGFVDIVAQGPTGEEMPGKVHCNLCCMSLVANNKTISRHCLGYSVKKGDETIFTETQHVKKVKKRQEASANAPLPTVGPSPPIIIQVHCDFFPQLFATFFVQMGNPSKQESEAPSAPLPKRPKLDETIDCVISKGNKQEEFLKDVVRAFASSNVPISKLAMGSPMRQLFDKYMKVDGEAPSLTMVDPNNLRGTWLPKVHGEGLSLCQDLCLLISCQEQRNCKTSSYYVAIGTDETDDSRPSNDYIMTVEIMLMPKELKVEEEPIAQSFHLQLEFPDAMNQDTLSVNVDKV